MFDLAVKNARVVGEAGVTEAGVYVKDGRFAATSGEVKDLRREVRDMKVLVADLTLENRLLKESMIADGGDEE